MIYLVSLHNNGARSQRRRMSHRQLSTNNRKWISSEHERSVLTYTIALLKYLDERSNWGHLDFLSIPQARFNYENLLRS
jgi:hypothetical protein